MTESFEHRHIGPNSEEMQHMLNSIGVKSLDELIEQTIPQNIRLNSPLGIGQAMTENRYLAHIRAVAEKNKVFKSYIGQGYYNCFTPPVILRNVLENPGWYTAYTPYQSEIAQGRLEALLNFQTMVTDLSGMEIANASLLDEASAAAEAMLLLYKTRTKKAEENRPRFFVSDQCFPQTIAVLRTRAEAMGIEIVVGELETIDFADGFFGILIQYPNARGEIRDHENLVAQAHNNNTKVAVAADILSLVLLSSPGSWGADVVFGSTQRFGVPMGFGGPHAAYFATKNEFKRFIPGRIIGVSVDRDGRIAYRMALQTREQHIRRDKATSNICTAQALLAVMASMYAVYHGPEGLRRIAEEVHKKTTLLNDALHKMGLKSVSKDFFDTIYLPSQEALDLKKLATVAADRHINFKFDRNGKGVGISLDETTTLDDIKNLLDVFKTVLATQPLALEIGSELPEALTLEKKWQRKDAILSHAVFNKHHSETELLRYLKHLENKDLSLTHAMIPLGSCTMKLNATSELIPISWSHFSDIHPFAPAEQTIGYREVIQELERDLSKITGFDAVSFQANSGAQGEFAGLMVIRSYHQANGDNNRNIVFVPSSAHGTNPASAVLAGMKVIVIACDEMGNIDINDLQEKLSLHGENLAALMVTYPSTHGVFEEQIVEINELIHEHGGQVYMDGANMNAQVGLTSPEIIGADVCHLNLHKTFAIPHGGGGPGMGPIAVAKHLTPHLPEHPFTSDAEEISSISAAPWGSALILLISYGYIKMLGESGLTRASQFAILNANYLATKLSNHFDILFRGKKGKVAHEMILDCRKFKNLAGVEVEDIAKRLMDYGFHAPTVSFPVAGTLMIEPTESEALEELDRFCDALIAIREEIAEIELGNASREDNVLKNAPHCLSNLVADHWIRPYSREKACFPLPYLRTSKFWVPVSRIDNAHGDRNLMCICPPVEDYVQEMA